MPIMANSNDGNTIFYYSKSSTTPMRISLDDLDKMTFNDEEILMWKQSGVEEIPFDEFLLFTFKEIEHPYITIVSPTLSSMDMHIKYIANHNSLHIESRMPLCDFKIIDTQGQIVANIPTNGTICDVTVSNLHHGVYFIKVMLNTKVYVQKIIL